MTAEARIALGAVAIGVALVFAAMWAGGPLLEFVFPRCWEVC